VAAERAKTAHAMVKMAGDGCGIHGKVLDSSDIC
jgi:hypothetical protein